MAERYVDRWERTEAIGGVEGEGQLEGRPVIVHRRPESHAFLVHSLVDEDLVDQEDGDQNMVPESMGSESHLLDRQESQTSEYLQQERGENEAGDLRISWTTTWEGVSGETPTCGQGEGDVQRSPVDSSSQESDFVLKVQGETVKSEIDCAGLVLQSKEFKEEEAFVIGIDREDMTASSSELLTETTSTRAMDREDNTQVNRNFRVEENFLVGLENGSKGEEGGECVTYGFKGDNDNTGNGDDEAAAAGGDEGQVTVVRRVERSFSIGEDGKRSQITDRLFQRRKTIEVDREDLSGLEAIHRSSLDISIGGDTTGAGTNQVSEINVIWGKTVEADLSHGHRSPVESPVLTSPREDTCSLGDTDTGEYWSGDVSTDTVRSSGSFDTYVDTGDSMYASDSAGSPRLSEFDYFSYSDKPMPSPSHSTPRVSRGTEKSEASHYMWDPLVSPLQPRSVTVWERESGRQVTITAQPETSPRTEPEKALESPSQGRETKFVSRMNITGGKTVVIAESQDDKDSRVEQVLNDPNYRRDNPARSLFKGSEDIFKTKAQGEKERPYDEKDSSQTPSVTTSDLGIYETVFVDRREECLEPGKRESLTIQLTRSALHFSPSGLTSLIGEEEKTLVVCDTNESELKRQESPHKLLAIEDEEIVPVRDRKKKKLRKKKKKDKTRAGDAYAPEETNVAGPPAEEKSPPLLDTDAVSTQFVIDSLNDDSDKTHKTICDVDSSRQEESENVTTHVSEEKGNSDSKHEKRQDEDPDLNESATSKTDNQSHNVLQDTRPSDFVDNVSLGAGDNASFSPPQSECKASQSNPAIQTEDYLTQILQGAAVDSATLLLHSEGQDGDVLLNVSKGRRRILKPHRRFTRERADRVETESHETEDGCQLKMPDSFSSEGTRSTPKGDNDSSLPFIPNTTEHKIEETRGEDVSGQGYTQERKRSADGNMKVVEGIGPSEDFNVDVKKGEQSEDEHETFFDNVESNNNEAKESNKDAKDGDFCDRHEKNTFGIVANVSREETVYQYASDSDVLTPSLEGVEWKSHDFLQDHDKSSASSDITLRNKDVLHNPDDFLFREDFVIQGDDNIITVHDAEHQVDFVDFGYGNNRSDRDIALSPTETISSEQDASVPFEVSSGAQPVAEFKEDQVKKAGLPQETEDNPLLWPKKGKKKKQKKNKKDKQAQDHPGATGKSAREAELLLRDDGGTQERRDHQVDEDNGTELLGQTPETVFGDGETRELDATQLARNLTDELAQEHEAGLKGVVKPQENECVSNVEVIRQEDQVTLPSPGSHEISKSAEGVDDGSKLSEDVGVFHDNSSWSETQSVDRVEEFYDDQLDNTGTVHRLIDKPQSFEFVPVETFLTMNYTLVADKVVTGSEVPSDNYVNDCGVSGVGSLDAVHVDEVDNVIRDIGEKPVVVAAAADGKNTSYVDTSAYVGDGDTVYFDASYVGDDTVYEDASDDIGDETLAVDDGQKLDELIKDLVSDVDIVAVRDVRIYIDDDLIKRVEDILPDGSEADSDSLALSEGEDQSLGMVQYGDDHSGQFVDRREECEPVASLRTLTRRLLEDVVNNRARAQEVATRDPEAGSMTLTSGTELTAGGHLLSEMALLETAAREQADSLKLAVAQQTTYEAQLQQLNSSISEAQGKLLSSPVMASSVGALKQQMAEHDDLAGQIKHYQNAVNEITEKSRELALDSAHLSPKLFRKHYLPESAYDDYFSAAQIHHRVGSPLPVSSPLFYDTLPTFSLEPPPAANTDQTGSGRHLAVPTAVTPSRKHTSLSDAPALSLDLPRKIPPPRKDTIPRPTWSDGTPNQTSPGKHAPGQSPGASRDKNGFFRQSETQEAPGESVSTSGYATAPSSARSVGAGAVPSVRKPDGNVLTSATATESGPNLSFKSHVRDKTPKSFKEITNKDRVLDSMSKPPIETISQRFASTTALSPSPGQEMRRQAKEVKADISSPSSRHTTSVDSGLDTGTNVSLTSGHQPRQTSPARSVSSVVERLAAAMAAGAPNRPPPAGARPTELVRMGGSLENLSSPRSPSARSDSVDSLVHHQPSLDTSQTLPRASSTQDSFQSLLSSPRVASPSAVNQLHRTLQTSTQKLASAVAPAPWKSVSESNLTTSVKSPRFGDASATSTPRLTSDQASGDTRERSSSFNKRLDHLGRPLGEGRDLKVKDASWATLQEQAQSKERELQAALQRQERYQQSVQQLTAKMERCSVKLANNPATMASPLDTQTREFKETLAEIEDIRSEIGQAREKGEQLMESPDSEGGKALQSTLTMLEDRFLSLQALADDKGRQLQEAKTHKERHAVERAAYEKRVAELREWLEEAKVRHASLTLPSDDPARLQEQVDQSKDIQAEVNVRLRQVSDLALQCDAVCEHEPPNQAERLRNQLAQLQKELGDLKLSTIEKQAELRAAIKDSEKRRRERDEVDTNVARLQKWMTDTKEMTKPSETATISLQPDINKDLVSDIKQHRQLVRQISDRKLRTAAPAGLPAPSDREVRDSWERLSRHLAQKRDNLQAMINTSKPGELVKISLHAPTRQAESANQLSDVKSIMGEMSVTWRELQTQLEEKKLSLDEAMTFQQQYQSALQGVSSWLDLAQQQLFTVPSTTEEHIRHNENLQKQLKSLQAEVAEMSDRGEELLISTDPTNRDLVEACLTSLDARLQLLSESARGQADDLHGAERDWCQYQDDLKQLKARLQDTQRLLLVQASPATSLDAMVDNNQKIEAQLKKCELQLSELKTKEASLTLAYPKGVFPSELATLQSNYLDLNRRAMEKRAIQQQSSSVQDQYQKMLNDYSAFLNTAQDKLRTDVISARDLTHLKQQLAAHKDFFSDLEVHQAMLTALADQCDTATRARLQSQHAPLMSLTQVLVDQASLHGQRLERLTRQWTELEEKHGRLTKVLSSLKSQVPRPVASGDSLTTIQDKLGKYKRLQTELADERASVFEVVDKGKQILHSVNCPGLESVVTNLADAWVDLNTDLTHELKRTETLGDQLSIFETEAAVLTSWLAAAKTKLNSFKQLSTSDLSNIGAVRTKVEKLLEFRKEIENQAPLRDRVLKAGQKLLLNQNYDTRGLSDRLDNYESEWRHLEDGAAKAGEFLHERQMELMPSRQAMTELTSWINQINKNLEDDAKRRVKSVADIEVMVKKYKGYRVEVTSKQMTLDFVNQSELAPQPEDEHVTHEKLDFADKLGEVNKNWVKVVKAINDRLASLEGINGQWLEYEQALEKLQAWFREQEDKVKRYKLIGHEVGVRQTLKDCKMLQQQLQAKQTDLTAVTSLGQKLVELSRESPGCQQSVRDSLESLQNTWTHLEEQTRQLENLLTDMLGQWAHYHTDLASLNQMLTQIEYALSQYTLIGGDIHTLRSQVGKLKKLQSEQQASAGHMEAFSNLSGQLRQVCEPPVQLDLQKTVADVQARWKQVAKDLADRLSRFDGCLALWQSYEDKYSHLLAWLDSREALCSSLITMRDDPDKQTDALTRGKNLQQELDKAQSQLAELYRLSDQLTGTMDPSTIATLTARQSGLEQRMMALRQVLQQHLASLTDDLSMLGRFNQAFKVVEKFLTYAGQILAPADPGRSDEEAELQNRLDQLRQLLLLFNTNYVKLDDVNDLGYRLALKDADAKRLLDLNHRWQDLYEDANERSRSLQGFLLVQQDFTAKCEAWMTFLAHTETDLAREIKGNLRDLQDQLRGCEQFESEMYSNQQILHAIISDGQKMMRAGEVDDVEEFQQKLQLLSEQWHSVTRRANQRRAIIEGLIAKWQEFNAKSEQLKTWLQDKQSAMAALEFDSDSLQVIRHLSEKVKMTQHEFELHEATFKRIHHLGSVLQQHADQAASREIKNTLTELETLWTQVFSGLDDQRVKLEGVDRQWLDCEDDIRDILTWLQDIRRVLYADIPNSHDAIQEEISKCRDITSSFASAEDKRQSLLSRERQLGRLVQTEDMNLLHQRIRLLNKQWEELRHQAVLREHRLTEALFRWTNLGERLRALMVWIEQMETKITSTPDMHVEDLLAKLENDYKLEMNEKEVEKKDVVSQGKQLMKVSSEIRASDIEQKILRLEDKWTHLVSVMDFRLRKLQETVLAVKQLDTSMKNLSRWLSQVENQLTGGLEFKDVGLREIQAKLQDTQELQEDIEQHSAGVSAVLNLCEVLLHDHDACPTQTEFLALQHAMKNLEKRWRNICNLSPRRRTRVEETWELWEQFRTDCQLFSDWLSQIEQEVRESEIEVRDVALAKQEISKYERLQRNVHDHLAQLENINRQYRQLAKDGRTDTDGQLRVAMTDLNNRWDAVQIKVTEIMKKLRHSATIRQDFEETRTSLISWLREVDNQLTDILHSTDLDLDEKVLEIRRIEDEVHTKRHRMDYLDQAGVYLMQKGDSQEALTVQAQLEDFRLLSNQVLERVVTTQLQVERLVVEQQVEDVAELEKAGSARHDHESSADRIRELRDTQTTVILERQTAELERYLEESPPESPPMPRRQDASPSRVTVPVSRYSHSPVRPVAQRSVSPSTSRSRPTPGPATSTVTPVTDSSLRSRSPSKVTTPRLRASGSPVRRMSPSPSRRSHLSSHLDQDVTDSRRSPAPDIGQLERSAKLEVLMEQLVEGFDDCNLKLVRLEQSMGSRSGRTDTDQQMQLLVQCEVAVDNVTRLHRLLKTESGVTSIASADAQVQLITKRWEVLQRRAMDREVRLSQHHHDLSKLEGDVDAMLGWLDEAEALQTSLRSLPDDIGQLDRVVRQYKDFLVQLESRKPIVLSINLLSRTHLASRSAETKSLRLKVQEMNQRWDLVLARAEEIQLDIQSSLLRCQEFHHTIDGYQVWLEGLEARVRQLEPLNLNQEEATLWNKYIVLVDTHSELQRNQSKVLSTKETADQLLVTSDSPNMCAARDSIHSIHKRMRSLMHLTAAYISSLENKLNIRPTRGSILSSLDLSEGRSSGLGSSHASRSSTPLRPGSSALRTRARSPFAISRQLLAGIFGPLLRSAALLHPYNLNTGYDTSSVANTTGSSRLLRVIRAALPIQLLLLLLLLLACLVPVCEDEHSCLLSNNLRHSFSPMLRYTDGAPPT